LQQVCDQRIRIEQEDTGRSEPRRRGLTPSAFEGVHDKQPVEVVSAKEPSCGLKVLIPQHREEDVLCAGRDRLSTGHQLEILLKKVRKGSPGRIVIVVILRLDNQAWADFSSARQEEPVAVGTHCDEVDVRQPPRY